MISVSTSWNASSFNDGLSIISQIRQLGIRNIELGSSLSEDIVCRIFEEKENDSISVSSVHNYCPVPDGYDPRKFTSDFFSLSSPLEEQRKMAVALTKKSIDTAKQVGTKFLIIHAGRVEMAEKTKDLIKLYNKGEKDTPLYNDLIDEIKNVRMRKKGPYLEAIKKSLKELLAYARTCAITICLENRFYYREIPSFDEIEELFNEFGQENSFCYWHDVGHAQVGENLGFCAHISYLKKYSHKMVGMHLHDIDGTRDHQAPGLGDFDFSILKPYLKKHTIKVLEIHQPATVEQIISGLDYLQKIGVLDTGEIKQI